MRERTGRILATLFLIGCVGLSGCAPRDGNEPAADELPAADRTQANGPRRDATRAEAEPIAAQRAVSTSGFGPVRIGMSVRELAPHLAAGTDTTTLAECDFVRIDGAPDSLDFMVVERRLARIDVRGGTVATAEGATIGDVESRIEELYPGLRRRPHKYTDGAYLIAIPASAPDTLHRYVFETDGRRVTRYRAGVYPPVEYVEGCS